MLSNNNQRVRYYIYGHYTKDTNILFYIGKGTILNLTTEKQISRYARAYHKSNRNKYWNNVVNKHGFYVKILFEYNNEVDCFNKERDLILKHGRRINNGILCNMTDGGEIGPTNRTFLMSERQRKILSEIKSTTLYVYNSLGQYLTSIKTIKATAKYCNVTYNAIHSCLQTKNYSNGYFIFREYKGLQLEYTVNSLNFKSTLSKKVITEDLEGIKILHDSIHDAVRYLKTDRKNLKTAIKKGRLCKKHKVYFEGTISSQASLEEGSETISRESTPKQVETANFTVVEQ